MFVCPILFPKFEGVHFLKMSTRQNEAWPYIISKIWWNRFKRMLIRQNQAWPNLLSKIWWSRFKRLSIRQNHVKPNLISKIWWNTFIKMPIQQNQAWPYLIWKMSTFDFLLIRCWNVEFCKEWKVGKDTIKKSFDMSKETKSKNDRGWIKNRQKL